MNMKPKTDMFIALFVKSFLIYTSDITKNTHLRHSRVLNYTWAWVAEKRPRLNGHWSPSHTPPILIIITGLFIIINPLTPPVVLNQVRNSDQPFIGNCKKSSDRILKLNSYICWLAIVWCFVESFCFKLGE